MHPRLRFWLIVGLGLLLGAKLAFDVAEENYILGGLLGLVIFWLLAEWVRGPLPDAWVLAGLLIGYLIGNRGFAQLFVAPSFPLLPAEAGLLVCAPVLLFRMAFKQGGGVQRDHLNFAIFAWMLLGAVRLPVDIRHYGFSALRDSAMVYYASFFFIAQAMCHHFASRQLLQRALGAGFLLLPVVTMASSLAPDFFLSTFTWRGTPLIYQKGDLVATYLASGFFFFWALREEGRGRYWLIPAAICLLMSPTVGSPRAAMFGTTVITVAWLLARRYRLAWFQLGIISGALAVLLPILMLYRNQNVRETMAYSVYEHAISIFDVAGTGTYLHAETGDPGSNNRFRLVWWSNVAQETLETNPVFGLGFGADLAARFLASYDEVDAEDFTTRSPHSVIMTVFGRMGLLGLGFFLGIVVMMARSAHLAFRLRAFEAMGLWSVAWGIWFSACFGVVLEGPMGAVIFWTVLGMAHHSTKAAAAGPMAETPALATAGTLTADVMEKVGA
jgi:hypothetical protein